MCPTLSESLVRKRLFAEGKKEEEEETSLFAKHLLPGARQAEGLSGWWSREPLGFSVPPCSLVQEPTLASL